MCCWGGDRRISMASYSLQHSRSMGLHSGNHILSDPQAQEGLLGGRSTIADLLTVLLCIGLVIMTALAILASLILEDNEPTLSNISNEIDLNAYLLRLQDAVPPFIDNWLTSLQLDGLADLCAKFSSCALESGRSIADGIPSFGQDTPYFLSAWV